MKAKIKSNIRVLRHILDQTQAEFAATIGVSKDAVASWEIGRNPVSAALARQIAVVTGADERALMNNDLPLLTMNPNPERRPYTVDEFKRHRKMFLGDATEAAVQRRMPVCLDTLKLLFTAAATYGKGPEDSRLPGVLSAFNQWCKETAENFELGPGIDAQLAKRPKPETSTRSYGQWREMAKELPHTARMWGFKDNPKKDDTESLTLGMTFFPVWVPGWDMRGGKK